VIIGGGPAGAYLALELARPEAGFTVEVYDDGGADRGVGIVLDAGFIDLLEARDRPSGRAIRDACQSWDVVRLRVGGTELATGGHQIYGLGRKEFVGILRARAGALGAVFHPRRGSPQVAQAHCDLLVGADGAGSVVRQASARHYRTRVSRGRTVYLWMRAPTRLPAGFCFVLAGPDAYVAHTYPYGVAETAVVVECRPGQPPAPGLFDADQPAVERALTGIFADHLGGAPLRAVTFPWQPFRTITNRRWSAGHHVLVGDAAHTTHFSVGSGTRLAVEDSIALAGELARDRVITAALARYEALRRPVIAQVQADARSSQLWFEDLGRHLRLTPVQLAFALRTRREVNSYDWLKTRDPQFAGQVLAALRADPRAGGSWVADPGADHCGTADPDVPGSLAGPAAAGGTASAGTAGPAGRVGTGMLVGSAGVTAPGGNVRRVGPAGGAASAGRSGPAGRGGPGRGGGPSGGGACAGPAPRELALRLGGLTVANRVAVVGATAAIDVGGIVPGLVLGRAALPAPAGPLPGSGPSSPPGGALGGALGNAADRTRGGSAGGAAARGVICGPAEYPRWRSARVDCLVLAGPWPAARSVLAARRPWLPALGVALRPGTWPAADAPMLAARADFVLVPAGERGQRVERTRLAEELRNAYGLTVLLWTRRMAAGEADTLIAAGRIDGYLLGPAMPAAGW
jgi:2-polyprenyl-6-methoxyphenol hydroxylase-like FAD-dependent oxidoreductase